VVPRFVALLIPAKPVCRQTHKMVLLAFVFLFGIICLLSKKPMTLITAIASFKGGVGRTTTALSLAAGLARNGHATLLIDIDPFAYATSLLLPNHDDLKEEQTVYTTIKHSAALPVKPTAIQNLFLVPSHDQLRDIALLDTQDDKDKATRLKTELDKIKTQYAYVVIDCPSSHDWLSINALTASDQVIVPISPGVTAFTSLHNTIAAIEKVKEVYNPLVFLRGLLYTRDDGTAQSKQNLARIRKTFPERTLKTVIPHDEALMDAAYKQQDIYGYNAHSAGAKAYMGLIKEAFNV
jgi:chromosome partitioning protein